MLDRTSVLSTLQLLRITPLPFGPVSAYKQHEMRRQSSYLWQFLDRRAPRLIPAMLPVGLVMFMLGAATVLFYLRTLPSGNVSLLQLLLVGALFAAVSLPSFYVMASAMPRYAWEFTPLERYTGPLPLQAQDLAQKILTDSPLHTLYVEHLALDPFLCLGGQMENKAPQDVQYLIGWDPKGNILSFS